MKYAPAGYSNLYGEAGAIVGNPQLALWHSFKNQAPGDPAHNEGKAGWMYGVRQYGMHTLLVYLTDVGNVNRYKLLCDFLESLIVYDDPCQVHHH